MAVTISGTSGVTFPDTSTQSTAATPPTTLYAVGQSITGRPQNFTTYSVNSTIAGSSLYSTTPGVYWNGGTLVDGITGSFPASSLVNVGTWRCVSPTCTAGTAAASAGVWVRIS